MAMRIYLEAKQTCPVDWFPTSFGHPYLVMRDASVVAGSPADELSLWISGHPAGPGPFGNIESQEGVFGTSKDWYVPGLGRIVLPGHPHHVTQRGNRRQPVFFEPSDYALYRDLLAEHCRKASVEVWAYCLMPNHVHLVLTPQTVTGLARALGETHRRYTGFVNARARWTGHLFQGRFGSVAMDDAHFVVAARYVALNPVRAKLVARAQDWPWSSVRAHLAGRDDALVRVAPLIDRIGSVSDWFETESDGASFAALRAAEASGRPLGADDFMIRIERTLGRSLQPRKPGRKPRVPMGDQLKLDIGNE